ncbi:MAG TPA: hypothetical protein VLF89_03210 [Candidatus Saccharimonadales bacterium]|nr:hypothetical protein [Candidatus Saccharimonadales bacterium]
MKNIQLIWKYWRKFGKKIGNFQALIIFTLFYFFVLWMIGFFVRFFSDPLNLKKIKKNSNFTLWDHPKETLEQAKQPF